MQDDTSLTNQPANYGYIYIRGPFEKFVGWWQYAAVMPPSV